jgi:hypothetical protein
MENVYCEVGTQSLNTIGLVHALIGQIILKTVEL